MEESSRENAVKVHDFLCFPVGGCAARVGKPGSTRLRAVQPAVEGRRLTSRFVIKNAGSRRVFASHLLHYTQAFQESGKGFSSVANGFSGDLLPISF